MAWTKGGEVMASREVREFYFLKRAAASWVLCSFKAVKTPKTWRAVARRGPGYGTVYPTESLGRVFHETPEAAFEQGIERAERQVDEAQENLSQLLTAQRVCMALMKGETDGK